MSNFQTITQTIQHVGLSSRRFIKVFTAQVGMTPKLFSRVVRFQHALRLIQDAKQIRWTDVALACGYYDQAHLISDFQEFSGMTLANYIQQRGDRLNQLPPTMFPLTL